MDLAQGIDLQAIDWHAIAPELVLTAAACVVLLLDLFLPRDAKWLAMPFSAAGLIGTLAAVVSLIGDERETLSGSFVVNNFALLFKGLFCVLGLLIVLIS